MSLNDDMELEFPSNDQVRTKPPRGTIAHVQVIPERDMVLGEFASGTNQFGDWMRIRFEVVDAHAGDDEVGAASRRFKGEWASTFLPVDTSNRVFRNFFHVVTGVDIAEGGALSFGEFKRELISNVFSAEIGPQSKKEGVDENGKPIWVDTDFTRLTKLIDKLGPRSEAPAIEAPEISVGVGAEDAGADLAADDIPF